MKLSMNLCFYPWQHTQWQQILTYLRRHSFPHALLLAGPEGMGKQDFSQALAARLLCQQTDSQVELACGHCRSCQWIQVEAHPDLLKLQISADSRVIKIDQIRALLEELSKTSQRGGRQVIIIFPAEAMNMAAANALLKMLEEPSGDVVFLLVSHQPGILPATIRSRCQQIIFPPPCPSLSLPWLTAQFPQRDVADSQLFLTLAENAPLRAYAFFDDHYWSTYNKMIDYFIRLSLGEIEDFAMVNTYLESGFQPFCNVLCMVTMDLIRLKCHPDLPIAHAYHRQSFMKIANQVTQVHLFSFMDALWVAKKYTENKINLNLPLFFEALLSQWLQPI